MLSIVNAISCKDGYDRPVGCSSRKKRNRRVYVSLVFHVELKKIKCIDDKWTKVCVGRSAWRTRAGISPWSCFSDFYALPRWFRRAPVLFYLPDGLRSGTTAWETQTTTRLLRRFRFRRLGCCIFCSSALSRVSSFFYRFSFIFKMLS